MIPIFGRILRIVDSGLTKLTGEDKTLLIVFRVLASILALLFLCWLTYVGGGIAASMFMTVFRFIAAPTMLWMYGILSSAVAAYFAVTLFLKFSAARAKRIESARHEKYESRFSQIRWGDPAPSFAQFCQAVDLGIEFGDDMTANELQEEIDFELDEDDDSEDTFNPPNDDWKSLPPTDKQISYAQSLGIVIPRKCTRGELSDLITDVTGS